MAGQVPPQATPIKALRKMKSRTFEGKLRTYKQSILSDLLYSDAFQYIWVLLSILYLDLHLFELLQDEKT